MTDLTPEELLIVIAQLRGHAMGLAENGRYPAGNRSDLTNADCVSYGELLSQAADTIERLEAGLGVILGEGQARRDWITAEQDLLETYIDEYVLSTEGADYEPTEFERELIRDALQGFVVEQDRLLCQHLRKASNLTKDRS